MLRSRASAVRLLDERDRDAVLAICDRDPVMHVFVSSRVRALGLEPSRLGAQMWGCGPSGRLESLCYSGANLVTVAATSDAIAAFADRALRQGRRCSSVVGPADEIQALWALLRPRWGPARDVRPVQPVMVINGPPLVPPDPLVRRVRIEELDILWPSPMVGETPTSSVNIATQAGQRTSSSSRRTRRTSGSGGTSGGPLMTMTGCTGRTSRAGPQRGRSKAHSA